MTSKIHSCDNRVQYDVRISTAVTCLEHLHDKDVAGFIHYCHGEFVSWGDILCRGVTFCVVG